MAKDRSKDQHQELEGALEREKRERADAEERATRANERAREADEAYRKLQLALVAAKDDASAARDEAKKIQAKASELEGEVKALREASAAPKPAAAASSSKEKAKEPSFPPARKTTQLEAVVPPAKQEPVILVPPPPSQEVIAQVENMLRRIEGLREMLATASNELSQLHADEVALHKRRSRVLTDACALLARAVGATGEVPPPIPSSALEARLTVAPVVDISEVADLIESLRPPRAPRVE